MDALLAALLSSFLAAIANGLLQSRRQSRRLDAEADQRLRDTLAEFGAALDALMLEMEQLPRPQRRAIAVWHWVERHLTALDFIFGRLARLLFGRQLYAAFDRLQRATNELMLIAPPRVLDALDPIFDHLSTFGERDEDWFELLQGKRSAFAAVSRSIATTDPIPPEPIRER